MKYKAFCRVDPYGSTNKSPIWQEQSHLQPSCQSNHVFYCFGGVMSNNVMDLSRKKNLSFKKWFSNSWSAVRKWIKIKHTRTMHAWINGIRFHIRNIKLWEYIPNLTRAATLVRPSVLQKILCLWFKVVTGLPAFFCKHILICCNSEAFKKIIAASI